MIPKATMPTTLRQSSCRPRIRLLSLAIIAATGFACVAPASAQSQGDAALPTTPTADATVNLIRLMVKKGLITEGEARGLVTQAQTEAAQVQQAQLQASQAATATVALQEAQGEQRIRYVPGVVQDEITAKAREQVMAQVEQEGWARPGTVPAWIDGLVLEGDVRLRSQSQYFGDGNIDSLIDFATLNRNGPYDANSDTNRTNPPFLNTRRDRSNAQARVRFGLRATLSDEWEAGLRVATGNDNGPVSTNQTLGGGLVKKDIWLDRGYLKWKPAYWVTLTGGRFQNPYLSTPLLFDEDLNFDGLAGNFELPLQSSTALRLFGTLGATPLEFTSNNFPTTNQNKAGNENKWLYGGQFGVDWSIDATNRLRAAVAYYNFNNISGKRSEPCALYLGGTTECSTDWSRPAFMQKGNTLMLLRNVVLDPSGALTPNPQYVGLASKFNLADLTLRYDTRIGDMPFGIEANYVKNLSFDAQQIQLRSEGQLVTNVTAITDAQGVPTGETVFDSGDSAYQLQATFGDAIPSKPGDWSALIGYRRIDPDALPDAYNDSDFNLGGTNAKGYYVGASWAMTDKVWLQGRWFSAQSVFGPPVDIDVLLLDVNARF